MNFEQIVFGAWDKVNDLYPIDPFEVIITGSSDGRIEKLGEYVKGNNAGRIIRQNEALADEYFVQSKEAQKQGYTSAVFFSGCRAVLENTLTKIKRPYFDRLNNLSLGIAAAREGILEYDGDNSQPIEQRHQETVRELTEEKERLNMRDFSLPFTRVYPGAKVVQGQIGVAEVERMTEALEKAHKRANQRTTSESPADAPNDWPELFTDYGIGLFKYLFTEVGTFKEITRANVLYHALMKKATVFMPTSNHEMFKDFLHTTYGFRPSKISPPNFKGDEFIAHTLPGLINNYDQWLAKSQGNELK